MRHATHAIRSCDFFHDIMLRFRLSWCEGEWFFSDQCHTPLLAAVISQYQWPRYSGNVQEISVHLIRFLRLSNIYGKPYSFSFPSEKCVATVRSQL